MLIKFSKLDMRTKLEKEIDNLLDEMSLIKPSSEEYKKMTENLEMMYKAKSHERVRHISPDTIAVVAGNLAGLVLIMNFEKANVITTKALGFVIRGRA